MKLSGLQNDANADLAEKRREARRKVDDADRKVIETELELSDAEHMKHDCIKERDRAEEEKKKLLDEWNVIKAQTYPEFVPLADYVEPLPLTEKDMICPTCGQELPEEVKNQRIADHEKRCEKAKADSIAITTVVTILKAVTIIVFIKYLPKGAIENAVLKLLHINFSGTIVGGV